MLETVFGFVIVLGIIVTVHEFGHFSVARGLGVKVRRFSVGFGTPLFSWKDRSGTEYVVAAIPLGGYVRMVDEREGEVLPEERPYAFNRKSVWARIAIVVAGPAANLLLAWVVYWGVFAAGVDAVRPVVGAVLPGTPAAEAGLAVGDEIRAVDGKATSSWQDVQIALLARAGETDAIELEVGPMGAARAQRRLQVPVSDWLRDAAENPLADLGVEPYRPPLEPVLEEVVPGEPADTAGLRAEDRVLQVDGEPIDNWMAFVEAVRTRAGEPVAVTVARGDQQLTVRIVPGERRENGVPIGYVGARVRPPVWPEQHLTEVRYPVWQAWWPALGKTWDMSAMTLASIQKMVTGLISVDNIGGPLTIARAAGASLSTGVEQLAMFIAYFSITLGIINLLPIPVLDGGHLLYFVIEAIRGRPLSPEIQMLGMRIGLVLLAVLMVFALYNDFSRL